MVMSILMHRAGELDASILPMVLIMFSLEAFLKILAFGLGFRFGRKKKPPKTIKEALTELSEEKVSAEPSEPSLQNQAYFSVGHQVTCVADDGDPRGL